MNVLTDDIIQVELTPEELTELLGDSPEIFRLYANADNTV